MAACISFDEYIVFSAFDTSDLTFFRTGPSNFFFNPLIALLLTLIFRENDTRLGVLTTLKLLPASFNFVFQYTVILAFDTLPA
eukprot:CAMPEP_0198732340 /NCGR_PEP_ID=MMETSP1475-20131203/35146_1 /TAXON_ID= ORGANISM="Unidentified sp., Strain CCMP1999" /NCGR_SAMPLE_ID=MMETSP1475 /ASSEMBLY_ACC=CAM_ASM_001111 /LENGTH=82 /DNA_ID=CAMNT_0044495423 /DNA_START=517 /DNA_END=765 /DNA_ORIENTATION=+